MRWVVDSVAVVESGDEAFIDEFFGILTVLAARATLDDGDKLRVQVSEAWSDRALGRVYSAAPRPDVAAGDVETTDRARTNADGERDEAVPFVEKLYVLVPASILIGLLTGMINALVYATILFACVTMPHMSFHVPASFDALDALELQTLSES